jgi:hypothetical protein
MADDFGNHLTSKLFFCLPDWNFAALWTGEDLFWTEVLSCFRYVMGSTA